jgi:PKD repeat protein
MPPLLALEPAAPVVDNRVPSTDRAPNAPVPGVEEGGWPFAGILAAPAYAHDIYPGMTFNFIPDLDVPGTWTTIVGSEPSFFSAGDFVTGEFDTQYVINYSTNEFIAVDAATGARTVIATVTPNGNWSGMTGAPDGTLYANSSVCGSSSTLYTIDPGTGVLTTIGDISNAPCLIDMAYNPNDDYIYGVDIVSDVPTGTLIHLPYGTYTATLIINNNDPVAGKQIVPVTMHIVEQFEPPTATFEALTPACLGEATAFTNTTYGGVPPASSYLWDLGDGMTSTLENPVHTYAAVGAYTVTLEACNKEALCDTYEAVVEVLPGPMADFSFVAAGLTVTFTNLSQNATSYMWYFGDGMTDTVENPVYTYGAAGTYTVTLEAMGACGIDTYEAVVKVCDPVQIVAVNPVAAGCVVTFSAELAGSAPFTYLWAFGDGMTSTLDMPVHTYAASGVYSGTLDVWNCTDGHDMVDFQVTVSCGPEMHYLYLPVIFKTVAP